MTLRPVVAAFDVDGTLTRRDCVVPFLARVGGRGAVAAALVRRPAAAVRALVRRDRDAVKEIVVGGVLAGRAVADVEHLADLFALDVQRDWLRADTVERLRWHQGAGHRTVLVSASLGVYLRPLARLLGVDAVLATEVVSDGTTFGPRLLGGNCRGEAKARRFREWLRDSGVEHAEVWAYGDSRGDRELLALADHPLLVGSAEVRREPEPTR